MALYEEYIPLVQLYPRTFARIETPASILAPMSEVVITNNFVPPDHLADEWEEALDEYADLWLLLPKVFNAWMPLLHPSDLRFAAGVENFATMLFALENKIKQYAQTLGTDPDTKDENLPANVEVFQSAVASFRELRRKPASSKKEGKSTKRSRSISVGPSDVETVEPDELDQEDVSMVDATQSSKIATLPDPPTDSDSEVEEVQKPVRKKVVTRSQKIVSDPKAEASSSKKSATSVPKEGDDSLSYRDVLKILDEANKLVGHAAKIPHTVDGLQCMDCAIRTHLSQIAIRISIEIAKYDAVFDEYNRIHQIIEARNIGPKDHTILDVGNQSIFPPSVHSTFPPVPITLSVAALVVAVVAVSRIHAPIPFDTVSDKLIHSFAYLHFETLVDTIPVLAE
ncbi:hypothetical protein B0H13DRAFT_2346589 [Mycena leptocephala]|nr:hypothetical protein B0H13DRAFT_2346589 [Mycena leptocephala]